MSRGPRVTTNNRFGERRGSIADRSRRQATRAARASRLVAVKASSRAGRPVVAHFRKQGATYERAFERNSAPPWYQSQVLRRQGKAIRTLSWGPRAHGPGEPTIVASSRFAPGSASSPYGGVTRRMYARPTPSSLRRLARVYRGIR